MKLAVIAYSAGNLGDDLFVELVARRYPGASINLISADEAALGPLRGLAGLRCVDLATFQRESDTYDALIVLGGSMFQQRPAWIRSWAAYARRFYLARRAGIPIFVIGASFGPYTTSLYPLAFRQLFRGCAWISFRDSASAELFEGIGSRWFADLAFAYDTSVIKSAPEVPDGPVGVSVMEFGPDRQVAGYEAAVVGLIEEVSKNRRVKVLCFQEGGAISDSRAANRVLGALGAETASKVQICNYADLGIEGLLNEMASCSLIVSTRFHAMVTAALLRKPVVAIGYHPKVRSTVDALGLEIEVLEPDMLSATAVVAAMSRSTAQGPIDVDGLATNANKHFEGLDRLNAAGLRREHGV